MAFVYFIEIPQPFQEIIRKYILPVSRNNGNFQPSIPDRHRLNTLPGHAFLGPGNNLAGRILVQTLFIHEISKIPFKIYQPQPDRNEIR